jgi:hypothetical protein
MNTSPPPSGLPENVLHLPLASSSLAFASYWPAEQVLEVGFLSGARYRYWDVPAPVHAALLSAASKGRYFNEAIRGRFPYRRS